MQAMLVEVNSASALKVLRSLSQNKEIRIVEETSSGSPALPGEATSLSDFQAWIEQAETAPTVSLDEAKKIWSAKRSSLQKSIR